MESDYDRRHFSILARYNRISNGTLLALLSDLNRGEFEAERGSHFGSIRGILGHLLMCDINWMRRFREVFGFEGSLAHPRLQPMGHAWTSIEFRTLEEFMGERTVVDGLLEDFVAEADTGHFGDILAYSDSQGTPRRYVFRDVLNHVFNHQTHHRGQVSQILDELGVEHDFSNMIDT